MQCLYGKIIIKVRKRIHELFHPTMKSSVNHFSIVEKATITQEECDELLKILNEWKVL